MTVTFFQTSGRAAGDSLFLLLLSVLGIKLNFSGFIQHVSLITDIT